MNGKKADTRNKDEEIWPGPGGKNSWQGVCPSCMTVPMHNSHKTYEYQYKKMTIKIRYKSQHTCVNY
jgi:hypothetical protein